jgi:hypothetical protein
MIIGFLITYAVLITVAAVCQGQAMKLRQRVKRSEDAYQATGRIIPTLLRRLHDINCEHCYAPISTIGTDAELIERVCYAANSKGRIEVVCDPCWEKWRTQGASWLAPTEWNEDQL